MSIFHKEIFNLLKCFNFHNYDLFILFNFCNLRQLNLFLLEINLIFLLT